ncbi:MAG: hypothetical protein WC002_09330, partial [Candidatus Muiribacteriota bacterium]
MKKNLLFFILFIFVCHVFSLAPPHPQMGAAGIDSFLQKKAFFENNTFGNLNNLMNFSPGLNSSPIRTALPVWEGEIKLIVIPLQFSDVTFTNETELYDNIDNNIFSMTNENSLANFYFKSSFGKVTVVPAIITDVVTSEKPMSYYGLADDYSSPNRPQWGSPDEIAKDALSLAYEIDEDFKTIVDNPASNAISIIDLNGDGMITGIESLPTPPDKVFVMVIHAGGAQEVNKGIKERIWSHQWVINICNNTDVFTGKGNDPNYTLSKSKIIGESVSVFLTYDESI